jgi:glycosyltransferase involved in cell wall biosynthesis
LLWRHRPNLVLPCGYERPETLASVIYSRISGAKTILVVENQRDDKKRNSIVETIKALYLKFIDGFCVGGETHLDYLKALGVPEGKASIGWDCVDNADIAVISSQSRASARPATLPENYFLCVARLSKRKNILRLIEAYQIYKVSLPAETRPWKLIICGDGELREEIIRRIFGMNLSGDILLSGHIYDFRELIRYYTSAKALILPSSQSEPWGLVVNEAMAAKTPVLVSKQCGCSGHLVEEGKNGFAFDGNSAQELADRMLWMHNNEHLLGVMGDESWRIVQQYSPEHFARSIKLLFSSIKGMSEAL